VLLKNKAYVISVKHLDSATGAERALSRPQDASKSHLEPHQGHGRLKPYKVHG